MQNDIGSEIRVATFEAEASLLGAILLLSENRKVLDEVAEIVSPLDFLDNVLHRPVFNAMLSAEGPPNQIIVAHELARNNRLRRGYCAELSVLVARCPSPLDYLHYARVVKKYSDERAATSPTKTEINYY